MRDMERDLRDMMQRTADGVHHAPRPDRGLVRRARLRRARTAVVTGAAAVALVVGGLAGARSLSRNDAAPVQPAEDNEGIEPMRNGRIIRGEWVAFDQDTGSFLYDGEPSNEGQSLRVVRQDEPIAEFDCPPSANCNTFNSAITFGPGPDEVTVPGSDLGSVQVIAFAGRVRNTLDISPVVTQDQRLTDLAWSPDGSRLAISTAGDPGEDGKVWILDRDGGEPQLVFTEAPDDLAPGLFGPVLGELAWSPDGRSLTLLVGSYPLDDLPPGDPGADAASGGVWPSLVALRLPPGQPVRAEALHVYDDVDMPPWNLPGHERLFFASAWSPDGTRIAVTSGDGVAEISAEDGRVLARHRAKEPLLLAWLPKP